MASEATGLGLSLGPSDPALVSGNELRPAVSDSCPRLTPLRTSEEVRARGEKKKTPLTKISDSK